MSILYNCGHRPSGVERMSPFGLHPFHATRPDFWPLFWFWPRASSWQAARKIVPVCTTLSFSKNIENEKKQRKNIKYSQNLDWEAVNDFWGEINAWNLILFRLIFLLIISEKNLKNFNMKIESNSKKLLTCKF